MAGQCDKGTAPFVTSGNAAIPSPACSLGGRIILRKDLDGSDLYPALFLSQFEVALKYQFENVIEHQSTVEVHAAQADFFLHGVDRVVG